jgi:uroporphyrin-III C-methyltransferase / precorrin-2 dehydrogenase / sirohydrochlorin ferrochelatase
MRPREASPSRMPQPARPPRMAPLATLPLFFKLEGKRVVVAGGSEAAAWKAELLSAAGATVEVWAADPCADMETLAAEPPGGPILLRRRAWDAAGFAGAELVVGAAGDEDEARRMFAAARQAGVPVNVIDRPAFCSFRFGAVVNRSPLVVGISTDGAVPMFGQAIRSRIEALLPAGFARWVEAATAWREELRNLKLGPAVRRRFWERFATLALRAPDRRPVAGDRDELLAEARVGDSGQQCEAGHVSLVGAGPGNPELLTLAAVRALRSADIILYDDLVAPEVLDFARREAKRMLVGKTGRRPSCRQDDINALMISLAKAGKRVVRLKSGDPMIFGRAGEEIAALERAGIALDVVPGVTAAQGAAASLKVSLTHRDSARRLQFVTGHARGGRLPDDLDVAALADPAATTAVYMPLGTLGDLSARLLAHGVDPGCPVSAVFNATRADERTIAGTLATIQALVQAANASGPCLLLMGRVLDSRHSAEQAGCDAGGADALRSYA